MPPPRRALTVAAIGLGAGASVLVGSAALLFAVTAIPPLIGSRITLDHTGRRSVAFTTMSALCRRVNAFWDWVEPKTPTNSDLRIVMCTEIAISVRAVAAPES